ncbi:putative pantoate--beta-alanine ligase [Actinacidiphila reveromycinica]|uniref:Pantothenate synthetase n=1 Tax=Actinacidiphila reveromycinica TaxID=659352 RepID=A0A7U3UV33_9ACTN|nr:pantoate--beta-alanine ligase [Streptomyces sp. SN-593]BBA99323.1 putative pantoate--beta-alanine ligase [Streptomyces sp. SN-593]
MTRLVHRARDLAPATAVVMTMGALHDGHAALIRAARAHAGSGVVTVTVFVNPLQFGPNEDLDRYPRTLEADVKLAEAAGADLVFAPGADEVYPGGPPQVRLAAGPMGEGFEGASRPGHFDGMLTVVAKLLHLTNPLPPVPGAARTAAFFGQKDAQQLALVRRMATDLNFPVDIVAVPTVREDDGVALSSRNRYLSDADRVSARALSRALFAGRDAAAGGPGAVLDAASAVLDAAASAEPPVGLDYLALVDPATFTAAAPDHTGPAVLAVAAKVGGTRLIDNLPLEFGAPE